MTPLLLASRQQNLVHQPTVMASGQVIEREQQEGVGFVSHSIDTIDTIDSHRDTIMGNDAVTDKTTTTDSSYISEECQTSIMSNMSITSTSTTEALHSSHTKKDLEDTTDQLTTCQEKSTSILQNSENLAGSECKKVKDESEEELTMSEDYPAYIDSNHGPKLPPYVSRLYPGSDLFKSEYCSIKQDRWGMAEHFHSENSKKRAK